MTEADHELLYTSINGAQVWAHPLHVGDERIENAEIARFFADTLGESSLLLPVSREPKAKNPDALIGEDYWEFKTNFAGTFSSLDNELRRAKDKADNIAINLTVPIDTQILAKAIRNRIRQSPSVQRLRLTSDDKLYDFSRREMTAKAFKVMIKNEGSPT